MANQLIDIKGDVIGGSIIQGNNNRVESKTVYKRSDSQKSEKPADLNELLTKLQDLINKTNELSADDKAEALNHVKALAAIGKNPNEKSKSKGILRWFKGLLPELPAAASTVIELKDVIESVAEMFAD